jgi:hypothetical protein
MQTFFNKHYILFYILLFLLIGLNIYAFLWKPSCPQSTNNYTYTPLPQPPTAPPAPPVIDSTSVIVACNSDVKSGGQGQTKTLHSLGNNAGRVYVNYEMHNQPDRMDIFLNGTYVASTNQEVSGTGTLFFDVPQSTKTNYCEIIITAPESGTAWDYKISCPQ